MAESRTSYAERVADVAADDVAVAAVAGSLHALIVAAAYRGGG